MPVTFALVVVGGGGIVFYIRFFIALSRERKVHNWRGGHWIRLRLESDEGAVLKSTERQREGSRAA